MKSRRLLALLQFERVSSRDVMVNHFDSLGTLDVWWRVVSVLETAPLVVSYLVASFFCWPNHPQ